MSAKKSKLIAFLLLLPAIIAFLLFKWLPILGTLVLSFLDWDFLTPPKSAGWENYIRLLGTHVETGHLIFNDLLFWKYFGNTLYIALGHLLIGLPIAFLIAKLLSRIDKGRNILKLCYLLPLATTGVGASITWRWILNPNCGLLNFYLAKLGISGPEWLCSTVWAKPSIIVTDLWTSIGIGIIAYMAALRSKGHLKAITLVMSVFIIAWAFYKFTEPYVMTGGGPAGATTTLLYYVYNNGFQWFKLGYASTISFLMVLVLFALGLIMWKLINRINLRISFAPNLFNESPPRFQRTSFIVYTVLILVILVEITPFLWAFSTSLKKPRDVYTYFPQWAPREQNLYMREDSGKVAICIFKKERGRFKVRIVEGEKKGQELLIFPREIIVERGKAYLNWGNYQSVLRSLPFGKLFLNGIFHCMGVCLLQVIICFMAAYSLSILKPPGGKFFWAVFISMMFIPSQVVIVPMFVAIFKICLHPITASHWPNFTVYTAALFPHAAWGIGIFLFRIFFDGLPKSLVEEARTRTNSEWKIFWREVLPEAKPMLLLVAVTSFILSWHHFFIPFMMGHSLQNKVLTVGLASLQGWHTTDWSILMAGVCLVAFPAIAILAFIFRSLHNRILSRLTITVKT